MNPRGNKFSRYVSTRNEIIEQLKLGRCDAFRRFISLKIECTRENKIYALIGIKMPTYLNGWIGFRETASRFPSFGVNSVVNYYVAIDLILRWKKPRLETPCILAKFSLRNSFVQGIFLKFLYFTLRVIFKPNVLYLIQQLAADEKLGPKRSSCS